MKTTMTIQATASRTVTAKAARRPVPAPKLKELSKQAVSMALAASLVLIPATAGPALAEQRDVTYLENLVEAYTASPPQMPSGIQSPDTVKEDVAAASDPRVNPYPGTGLEFDSSYASSFDSLGSSLRSGLDNAKDTVASNLPGSSSDLGSNIRSGFEDAKDTVASNLPGSGSSRSLPERVRDQGDRAGAEVAGRGREAGASAGQGLLGIFGGNK